MMMTVIVMTVIVMMAVAFFLMLTHNIGCSVAVVVSVAVIVSVAVAVSVAVRVAVRVAVAVRMAVAVMPPGFSIEAPSIWPKDIELYRVDLAADNRAGADRQLAWGKAKPCKPFFHHAKRHAGIQQCTNGHIAADSRETIEICNLHPLAPKLGGKDRDFREGLRQPPLLQKC